MTPMVRKNFEDDPHLQKIWEDSNFLGRIAQPREFRGAALFLLSDASSFMTGSQVSALPGDEICLLNLYDSSSLMVDIQLGRHCNTAIAFPTIPSSAVTSLLLAMA
jgi:Enoyl-(Acyl carrier protein) reductase